MWKQLSGQKRSGSCMMPAIGSQTGYLLIFATPGLVLLPYMLQQLKDIWRPLSKYESKQGTVG